MLGVRQGATRCAWAPSHCTPYTLQDQGSFLLACRLLFLQSAGARLSLARDAACVPGRSAPREAARMHRLCCRVVALLWGAGRGHVYQVLQVQLHGRHGAVRALRLPPSLPPALLGAVQARLG
jgi:hypothetical protein